MNYPYPVQRIPIETVRPTMINVSLILCTRNRADLLQEALNAAFAAAELVPEMGFEAVVVDNGSTDSTPQVLADWQRKTGRELTCLFEPVPGVSRAKNLGIQATKGEIIVLTDDDCRMYPEYFRDLIRHFQDDCEVVLRGGRVELGNSEDLPFTIKTDHEIARYSPPAHPGGFVHGCNIAARRELFNLIGVFDTRFGPGAPFSAAEDTDLVWRAFRAGIPVEYVPDMRVQHFHGRKRKDDIDHLQYLYHFGNGALLAKHRRGGRLLARHLWWNLRNGMREWVGGQKFNSELSLSHWSLVRPNILGILSYLWYSLRVTRRRQKTG